MLRKKFGPPVVATVLWAASGTLGPAVAGNRTHHVGIPAVQHPPFDRYRPLYGYYTRHGQYVPGAGDRLIYGPGYVFVPGRGFSMRPATCPQARVRTSTATCGSVPRRRSLPTVDAASPPPWPVEEWEFAEQTVLVWLS
jgi:hypothetical protein